jgi:ribulose-5-phosphate 4-epimerase/fuculose-1-phosphate aldolase
MIDEGYTKYECDWREAPALPEEAVAELNAWVTRCDIEANKVHCEGPVQASSEALTHAAIYALDPAIRAVVHVHSVAMWNKLIDTFPTTSRDVSYGTPEMAREFRRLYEETDFGQQGVAIMGGHEEGIVSFGRDVGQATERVLQHQD